MLAGARSSDRGFLEPGFQATGTAKTWIAPFTVVNLVAGAAGVDFPTFLLRTIVTLAAGIAVMALLADRFVQAVRHPTPGRIAGVCLVTLLLLLLGPLARRRHWGAG